MFSQPTAKMVGTKFHPVMSPAVFVLYDARSLLDWSVHGTHQHPLLWIIILYFALCGQAVPCGELKACFAERTREVLAMNLSHAGSSLDLPFGSNVSCNTEDSQTCLALFVECRWAIKEILMIDVPDSWQSLWQNMHGCLVFTKSNSDLQRSVELVDLEMWIIPV